MRRPPGHPVESVATRADVEIALAVDGGLAEVGGHSGQVHLLHAPLVIQAQEALLTEGIQGVVAFEETDDGATG